MPDHDHTCHFWLYYITENGKILDNPYLPVPEHIGSGYECSCGATPSGVAP